MRPLHLRSVVSILSIFGLWIVLASCSVFRGPESTPVPTAVPSLAPSRTPAPPTATPLPSNTPTPVPSATPIPRPTAFGGGTGRLFFFCSDGLYSLPAVGGATSKGVKMRLNPLSIARYEWNPSGTTLVMEAQGDLYSMNADGGAFTPLTENANQKSVDAHWSPDGSKIVFTTQRGSVSNIFVMNPDGSGMANLTQSQAANRLPVWSPDGSKIYYVEGFAPAAFYEINPDGSGKTLLAGNVGVTSVYSVSADGSKLLYMTGEGKVTRLMALDINAKKVVDINPKLGGGSGAWSADGKKIFFISTLSGRPNLYVMDADGQNPVNLTNNTGTDVNPVVSPDGSKVAFYSDREKKKGYYMVNADGTGYTLLLLPLGCGNVTWQP